MNLLHFELFFSVKSTDNSTSPVLQLLVQRLKPVLTGELVQQIKTTYQFNIATLGEFYLDLKNGLLLNNKFLKIVFFKIIRQWFLRHRSISIILT
jgi:hypothetical protein